MAAATAFLLIPDDVQRELASNGVPCEFRGYSLGTLAAEMDAVLANADMRVRDPVYHVVLSWPSHEDPTDDQVFQAARHAIAAVGMADHQYLAAIHRDTDNVHVHIAVNRVHPDSYRAVSPYRDFYKLDRAMREIELRFGWSHDAGPYAVFERNGVSVIDWATPAPATQEKMPSAAADLERHTGETSFFTYTRGKPRDKVLALLKRERATWPELHNTLASEGLALRPKGQGFAVYDLRDPQTPPIKASDMHESLSRTRLERRLGPYEAPVEDLPVPEPHDTYDRRRELKRDPAERESRRQERAQARRALRDAYQAYRSGFVVRRISRAESLARYRVVQEEARRKRREVADTVTDRAARKALYSVIAFETLRAREALRAELAAERARLRADPTNRAMSYREWVESMAAAGDAAAISQLRGWAYADTRAKAAERRNSAGAADYSQPHDPFATAGVAGLSFAVQRDGSVLYRDAAGRARFHDHGQEVLMVGEAAADDSSVLTALRFAAEKYKGRFNVTGTPEFRRTAFVLLAEHKISVAPSDPAQATELARITREVGRLSGRSPGTRR